MAQRRKAMEERVLLDEEEATTARRSSSSSKLCHLLTLEETPAWYESSKFILTGYRPESGSIPLCFVSWTYLHNETGNIFSHLIPAVFCVLGQWTLHSYLSARYPNISLGDQYMLAFHLLSATICLAVSAHYHTFMNHSLGVAKQWLMFDYMGIVTLILGDFINGIYFGFYCDKGPKCIYWFMVVCVPFLQE